MGEHPNHIDPRPKRRKDQANPYHIFTVGIESADPHFYLSFIDSQGVKICMEISRELFSQLNQFELEDLSYLNQIDNHYEHREQSVWTAMIGSMRPLRSSPRVSGADCGCITLVVLHTRKSQRSMVVRSRQLPNLSQLENEDWQ